MLEYTEIHVPFKDLFTDINKDEYRQIFSKGEINDIKLNTSIPMQLFKKEALPTELYDRTEDLPVYIIINAGILVDSILKELGSDVDKDTAINKAIELIMGKQCEFVKDLFVIH